MIILISEHWILSLLLFTVLLSIVISIFKERDSLVSFINCFIDILLHIAPYTIAYIVLEEYVPSIHNADPVLNIIIKLPICAIIAYSLDRATHKTLSKISNNISENIKDEVYPAHLLFSYLNNFKYYVKYLLESKTSEDANKVIILNHVYKDIYDLNSKPRRCAEWITLPKGNGPSAQLLIAASWLSTGG